MSSGLDASVYILFSYSCFLISLILGSIVASFSASLQEALVDLVVVFVISVVFCVLFMLVSKRLIDYLTDDDRPKYVTEEYRQYR